MERHMGMIYNLALTYMVPQQVRPCFMEQALIQATMNLNECRIPTNMDKTPYEMFF
jgi:hypothetical protein